MGMPISTYTVLRGLATGDLDSYERNAARKAVASFRLFAFIIHDPDAHPDFDRFLSHNFDEFDYITGPHLLFFALVDPPREWLRHAAGRGYYEKIKAWETEQMLRPDHAIVSADSGLTAFTLANSLNIPVEMLPCLIVTDDFQADQYLWVKTCKEHIRTQLQSLGYTASRSKRPIRFNSAELDLCNGWGTEALTTSLADALTDLLSFIVARRSSIPYERSVARERASRALERLSTSLQAVKRVAEPEQETFEKLCLTLSSYLAQLGEDSEEPSVEVVAIPSSLLEQDSYQILRTAYKVLEVLIAGGDRSGVRLGPSYDFTPAIVCFAKVFEREANFSLVHWIRKELGISLPTYFNKPQPGIVARLESIDFNANRRGHWFPPGMGKSEFACLKMAKTNLPVRWDEVSWALLASHWKVIRERRNEAAHVRFVSEEAAFQVKESIEELASNGIFERMYEMKNEYRGDDSSRREPEQSTEVMVLGFNFNAELKKAEDHFVKGQIGECLKAIGKMRPYATQQHEQAIVGQLEDRATEAQKTRLDQVAEFSELLDRIDLFLKKHCPLCGKELAGATRCWEESCEPLWDTVKNLGLFSYREEGILNLSDAAFKQLLTFLAGLKIHPKNN